MEPNELSREQDGPNCYETIHPDLVPANRLLKQRDELARLCGDILATLRLPANQDAKFKDIPLHIKDWRNRFTEHSGNPNS